MFRFSVCGKKVMAQVRLSQEMMEMEMMDRKFQSQMFMGMDPLDRMSNPWDEEFGVRRGGVRGRRGGMMGRGPGWGGVVRRPDPEYLAYTSRHTGAGGAGEAGRPGPGAVRETVLSIHFSMISMRRLRARPRARLAL